MANIPLTNGESYRIGKVNTDPLLTGGSDHAHSPMKIRNGIEITGGGRARISVASNGNTPAAIFSTDPTSIGPSNQGASAVYSGIFGSQKEPTVVSFAGMSGSFADVPNALNDLEYGHLSYVAVGGDGGDLGNAGSVAGIGFHCDDSFVRERVNAAILGRRYATDAGSNNRTDILFATNQADGTDLNSSLFERVRITWDGAFQVKDKTGASNDYVWINDNGSDGRIGTTRTNFDFHANGDVSSASHIMRISTSGGGFMQILGDTKFYYNNPPGESGGQTMKWNTSSKYMFRDTSTIKLKYGIRTLSENVCSNFHKLRPVEFKHKADNLPYYGFIAEEVAEINPRYAVWGEDYQYDENGKIKQKLDPEDPDKRVPDLASDYIVPASIDDRAILAAAVAKIQELEARIKELECK